MTQFLQLLLRDGATMLPGVSFEDDWTPADLARHYSMVFTASFTEGHALTAEQNEQFVLIVEDGANWLYRVNSVQQIYDNLHQFMHGIS